MSLERAAGEMPALDAATLTACVELVARCIALRPAQNTVAAPEYPNGRLDTVDNPDDLLFLPKVAAAYKAKLETGDVATWSAAELEAARAFVKVGTAAPGTAEISREALAPLFPHAASLCTPNYGSFGGAPIMVTAVQHAMQQVLVDGDSDYYLRKRLVGDLEDSHRGVAAVMGLQSTANITMVDNAADAFNVVAQSVIFDPVFYRQVKTATGAPAADPLRIFMMSNAYPMVKACVAYWMNRQLDTIATVQATCGDAAAAGLWKHEVTLCELTEAMVLSLNDEVPQLLINSIADQAIASRADVVILDHVAFAPAFVMPIEAICAKIKASRPHCFICLDAAHAIGAIPLGCHFADGRKPPFDAWFSNLHKWMMAPKHAAVLWFADAFVEYFHPSTISNVYRGQPFDDLVKPSPEGPRNRTEILKSMGILYEWANPASRRRAEFVWRGTRDHSCQLVLPELLWFRRQLGEVRLMEYNNRLAMQAAEAVAAIWGSSVLITRPSALSSMSNVALPPGTTPAGAYAAAALLLNKYSVNLPIINLQGKTYARLSAQVLNDVSVYESAARRYLACLDEVRKPSQQSS